MSRHRFPILNTPHRGDIIHVVQRRGQLRFAIQTGYYFLESNRLISNHRLKDRILMGSFSRDGMAQRGKWRLLQVEEPKIGDVIMAEIIVED